jgi:hypothetical protein
LAGEDRLATAIQPSLHFDCPFGLTFLLEPNESTSQCAAMAALQH